MGSGRCDDDETPDVQGQATQQPRCGVQRGFSIQWALTGFDPVTFGDPKPSLYQLNDERVADGGR